MNRRRKKKPQTDYLALAKENVTKIEFKPLLMRVQRLWDFLPTLHRRALAVLVPILLILVLWPTKKLDPQPVVEKAPQRVALDINTRGLSEQHDSQQSDSKSAMWQEYLVQNGDTLAQVFRANQLAMGDLNALVKIEGADKPLSHIKQGQLVRFKLNEAGQLDILQLEKGNSSVMFFRLSDGGFGRSK